MKMKHCAYCGKFVDRPDKEHVFPKCLYPKRQTKVNRLTIPACNDCNNSWSDDEAHFRNMLVLAGEDPNTARQELWATTTIRSFEKIDGLRRANDLVEKMKPLTTSDGSRYTIFPGEDERVMRVVRKVIRGLCYYHDIESPVSSQRIWADVMKYATPQEFLDEMTFCHRERDVVEYRYKVLNEKGIMSVWLITFYETVTFIGLVSSSEEGFTQ